MKTITYLRAGRQRRSTGTMCGANSLGQWVKPAHIGWKRVLVTKEEVAAGAKQPPYTPRQKNAESPEKEKRERKPKPPVVPRWKLLVDSLRLFRFPSSDGRKTAEVQIDLLLTIADELESAHTQPSLPL